MSVTLEPHHLCIAGGGPAALEGALAVQALAEERVRVTLVAPGTTFDYRPLAVAEPFGLGEVARFSLPGMCAERGFAHARDALASVDVSRHQATLASGSTVDYDSLLAAVGARGEVALPGALTFRGSEDVAALRDALTKANAWTLPLYELALMTARWAEQERLPLEVWLVTHEARALGVFGPEVSARMGDRLDEAGVRLRTGAFAQAVEDGRLWLDMEGGFPVDLVVTLPRLVGPAISGLPADQHGFLLVDAHGRVDGAPDVYAAGDVTTRPLRQGGLATQQAAAAAAAIAVRAGASVDAGPYRPALRGLLLTGRRPEYFSREAGGAGEISEEALWWPPHKIASRHLGPYLAAHPELRETNATSSVRPAGRPAAGTTEHTTA